MKKLTPATMRSVKGGDQWNATNNPERFTINP